MAPQVSNIYPSDGSTNIPIGIDIFITFDSEIDQERARNNIMIFGPDFDQTSGPDSLIWVNPAEGYNPYFLNSPGFNGDLKFNMYFDLLNSDNTVFSGLDYHTGSPSYKTRIKITPKKPLAPETTYTVYIIGDPETTDDIVRGISSRTVYSTQFGANTGSGNVVFNGGYTGSVEDTITVEITEAGNIGTAEYQWYTNSNPTIVFSGTTSRKYRSLVDTGVELRFTGSSFQVGDTFSVNLYPPVYMESSYKYTFTTGTGSIVSIPSTTSTSVLGDPETTTSDSEEFELLEITPDHKSNKISPNVRVIKIKFSNTVDPTTITDKNIAITAHPANGYDSNVTDVGRVNKFMIVDDDTVYILLQTGEA